MALYSGRLLMRGGNEADFNPDKMLPREWAVSTDKKIVRICVAPGICIRMATYDAFEEDMAKIENILKECQTIQEVVVRINAEVSQNADAVAEYTEQAKQYRDEAKRYRDEAEAITGIGIGTTEKAGIVKPDGTSITVDEDGTIHAIGGGQSGTVDYNELKNKPSINGVELNGEKTLEELGIASVEELNKTNVKVDTIIEKADLGIKETASGEEIHLTDSAEGKAVEFALFGNTKQETTSGKNLIPYPYYESTKERFGVTFTINSDGTVHVNGTNTNEDGTSYLFLIGPNDNYVLTKGNYIISGTPTENNSDKKCWLSVTRQSDSVRLASDTGSGATFTLEEDTQIRISIIVNKTGIANNLTFKPMLRLADTDDTWEQPTNGATPRPDYPQDIEVAGESYNLIPYPYYETTKEANGVLFTLNENDGSIVVNGTATANGSFIFNHRIDNTMILGAGEYKVSGCPSGGSYTTYRLIVGKTSSAGSFEVVTKDFGSGAIFTLTEDTDVYVAFEVLNGATLSNLVVRPMIHKASVKNNRYMPYGKGSVEVKSVGKNLLAYPYVHTTKTTNGITWTDNGDGTITANGTATNSSDFDLYRGTDLKAGIYKFSKGNSDLVSSLNVNRYDKNTNTYLTAILSSKEIEKQFELTEDDVNNYIIRIYVRYSVNQVANNLVYKPMLRLASDADNTWQPYKETISTIPTPNGLAGIKVDSGVNYTDSNGQQWICDEIVKYADGSGESIQRVGKEVFDGSADEGWEIRSTNDSTKRRLMTELLNNKIKMLSDPNKVVDMLCDKFRAVSGNRTYLLREGIALHDRVYVYSEKFNTTDITLWTSYLAENPMTLYYELAEPIRTPLTAEQIAEIEKLSTFYPVTNISNDFDCGMKVTYLADSKNYIDNKLALQAKAREEEMMSMFLLLPEETQAAMIENDTNNLMLGMEE